MKRIALIQGFADFHYEMLGYVIEYCLLREDVIVFDVFVTLSDISRTYETLFNNVFGIKISWRAISELKHEDYDYIVLLTDDDYHYSGLDAIAEKVIIVDHESYIRRRGDFLARIGTRKRGEYLEVLPVFRGFPSLKVKTVALNNSSDEIHVCCIGVSNIPNSPRELLDWFGDSFYKAHFHFVARRITCRNAFRNLSNVHMYENTDPGTYFDLLRKSLFVLCANTDVDYEKDLMSGALPISFTFGCKLIMPASWQRHLCYRSALVYGSDNVIDLACKEVQRLDGVFAELEDFLNHRNKTFDEILSLK